MTVSEVVAASTDFLKAKGVPSPRVDAEHLIAKGLGVTRLDLYLQYDRDADGGRADGLPRARAASGHARAARVHPRRVGVPPADARRRRARADPEARDRGRRRAVPRAARGRRRALGARRRHGDRRDRAGDRGRAAGCDGDGHRRLREALALAAANGDRTGVGDRVAFVQGDLADGLPAGPFDLVVSNPPYVEPEDIDSLQAEVRDWEPREALLGQGVTRPVAGGARRADAGGALVLEVADGDGAGRLRAARGARLLRRARDAGSLGTRPGRRRQMDAVTAAVAALRAAGPSSCPRTPSTGSAPMRSRRRRAGWRSRSRDGRRAARGARRRLGRRVARAGARASRGGPLRAPSGPGHARLREPGRRYSWLGAETIGVRVPALPGPPRRCSRGRRGDGDEREPPRRAGPAHARRCPRGVARRLRRARRRRRAAGRAVDRARPLRRRAARPPRGRRPGAPRRSPSSPPSGAPEYDPPGWLRRHSRSTSCARLR